MSGFILVILECDFTRLSDFKAFLLLPFKLKLEYRFLGAAFKLLKYCSCLDY